MTTVLTDSNLYPEKSGRVKDYSSLASAVLLFIFAILAFMKNWFWRVLLCIIIIIAILGNMSERIGYRVYVQNEADTMSPIYFKDIHHLVIPLLNNHNVEK